MAKKILELYLTEDQEGEEYTVQVEEGYSRFQAVSHLLKALAEGLFEINSLLTETLELQKKKARK